MHLNSSFPTSFDNVPITRTEPHETLRLCFLINGNKYWVATNNTLEVNSLHQIALTLKENSYHLYVGKDKENMSMAANFNIVIPSDIFDKNFQLGHHLHSNQAQGTYDELYIKKTAVNQSTIDLWHASATEKVDLNESVTVDVKRNPIVAGEGAVVINTDGIFGYNNGVKRAGLGTDGRFTCGGGAVRADENGLTTYNGSTPQITIGSNGKLTFADGAVVADSTGLRTYNNGVLQCNIGTDGKLTAGGGNVVLDSNGISITNGKLMITNGSITILDGTKKVLNIWSGPWTTIVPARTQDIIGKATVTWPDPGYKPMFLCYSYLIDDTYTQMWGKNIHDRGYLITAYPYLLNNYTLRIENTYSCQAVCTVYVIGSYVI